MSPLYNPLPIATAAEVATGAEPGKAVSPAGLRATLMVNTVAAAGATETLEIGKYACHDITFDQNCVVSFSTPVAAGYLAASIIILRQPAAGGKTITLPTIKWSGGITPVFSTAVNNRTDIQVYSYDGGATWVGSVVGDGIA